MSNFKQSIEYMVVDSLSNDCFLHSLINRCFRRFGHVDENDEYFINIYLNLIEFVSLIESQSYKDN